MARFLRGELIGRRVRVGGPGIRGTIINETKNTVTIRTENGDKRIIKSEHDITFILPEQEITVQGKALALRPEDRIKHNW